MTKSSRCAIQVSGLDVSYHGVRALRGIDLSVQKGSFVLIGGPSGSGKSTLALALLGLLGPDGDAPADVRGYVSLEELKPGLNTAAELSAQVGLVFQNPATQLFNGTVEEEVAFGPRNLALEASEVATRVDEALTVVGCESLRRRSVRHLSGGEQQRVAIAASLAMRPATLILDEPTANLDEDGTATVVRTLNNLRSDHGVTIVVIEHRLRPFAKSASRLIWLEKGRVVADGPPRDVMPQVDPPPLDSFVGPSGGPPLVTLEGVTVGYNGRAVLRGCSLTLHEGDFGAIVGPNGAGKSTVARTLAGLMRPHRGRVVWHNGRGRARRVGFLQQNPLHQLVCSTVEEEVWFGPRNLGIADEDSLNALLDETGLDGLKHRPTQALSVGEQQRTALAATLSSDPKLLILDEPTLGQDRHHLRQLMSLVQTLNRHGQTVLLITHDHNLVAQSANRVWEMSGRCLREKNGRGS